MVRNRWIWRFTGICILLLIFVLVYPFKGRTPDIPDQSTAIAQGVAYLQSLEKQDPNAVDEILKQRRQDQLQAMRDQRLQQLESGEISVWSLFEDYVLLGDSRAVGFSYYGFMPENRVIAEGGATILDLEANIPSIKALNPSNIFLCYGLNDVSIGNWNTPEEYSAQYRDIILEIEDQLSDANIYISSILPARDPAFQQSSAWYNIPEYSQAVSDMCDTLPRCYYVDNDVIAQEYADLWDSDGIHVQEDFYPHWAANLILAVYSATLEDTDSANSADSSADDSSF